LRNKAVEEERKAEIITLSLLSLGEDFPLKTCTDNFSNVMKDLLEAGLDYDAKNLALEYFIRN
jgi:hypothetical protein